MRMTLCDVIDEWPLCENAHVLSAWYSGMSIRPCVGRASCVAVDEIYYVLNVKVGLRVQYPVETPLTPMNGVGKSRKASKVLAYMMTPASKA